MGKLAIGLLLAAIPILAFIFQYHFSKKDKRLKYFKNNFIIYYLDFIFVPLGFIFAYTLQFPLSFFMFFIALSVILNILLHTLFWFGKKKGIEKGYMFTKTMRLNTAGKIHFLFSTIETFFILEFLFFSIENIWTRAGFILLVIFFLGAIMDATRRGWLKIFPHPQ